MLPESLSKHELESWRQRVAELAQDSGRAYWVAVRTVGVPALAEEAVQEAYHRLLQHPVRDQGAAQARVYLLKTVRNIAMDLARSSGRRKRREEQVSMKRDVAMPSPEHITEQAEVARAARRELDHLPQEEREAVGLCCEQDLTREAAAEIMGIPERTVSYRLQCGLEKLQRALTAQGFAALTPIVLGDQLRSLGLPPTPSQLSGWVQNTVQTAHQSVRRSLRTAAPRASFATGNAAVVGALLVGVAAVGTWVWISTATGTPPPVPLPQSKAVEEALPVARWNFADGPAKDLEILSGTWTWKRPIEGVPGFMVTATNKETVLALPVRVPAHPVVVTIKLRWQGPAASPRWVGAHWFDDKEILKHTNRWKATGPGTSPAHGTFEFRQYFIDRFTIQQFAGQFTVINEHVKANPAERIAVAVTNFEVQEIELRTIKRADLPQEVQDPERLIRELGKK